MVIIIISDAKNVFMPMFQLFYSVVVQWSQTVTGYLESHNVVSVLVASHLSREKEHVGASAVLIVKTYCHQRLLCGKLLLSRVMAYGNVIR